MISGLRTIACALAIAAGAPLAGQAPAPSPAPPVQRIPAEALAALPFIRTPVLSPDGHHLAARMTSRGKNWIAIYDLRLNFEEQRPLLIEEGDYDITWLRWAGNERLLFGLRVIRTIAEVEIPVTRAGSIDLRNGQTTPLIGGNGIMGDDIVFVDPAGA